MKRKNNKNAFNRRAFAAIGILLFFIGLTLSGVMLQVRDHQAYTFKKVYWKVMHNLMALAFLAFSVAHIGRNRKILKAYITKAKSAAIGKEMIWGLILLISILLACLFLSIYLTQTHNIHK
jgi:uncharacterized membrane protein